MNIAIIGLDLNIVMNIVKNTQLEQCLTVRVEAQINKNKLF
ncbi:MAG: hypothetical protein QW327_05725 [Candidatus Odinarchaeota archaeon]